MLHTTTGYGYQLGSSNKTILVLRIKKESRDSTPLCTHYIFCRDVFRENWPPWKVATLSKPHPIDRNKKAPESISLFAAQSCSSPCAQNGSNALCLLVETMICCRLPLNHLGQNIANLFDQHNKYHVSCWLFSHRSEIFALSLPRKPQEEDHFECYFEHLDCAATRNVLPSVPAAAQTGEMP
jgi:hypothetical protein